MQSHPASVALLLAACVTLTAALPGRANETNPAPAVAAKPLDLFADQIVAQGKGVKVTRAQLDEQVVNLKAASVARGQMIPPDRMKAVEQQVLGRLIGMQILNARATDADRAKGEETAQKRFELIRENAGSEENFARQLKTVSMTVEELRRKLVEEAVADAVLERELSFEVSDADVKKFYEENPSEFEQPERVRAAHVLISTRGEDGKELSAEQKAEKRKRAEDIVKRARAGADFAELAREFSDDPGSRNKGGEYTFPRGQMVPEFEAAAFALEPGKVSDVVTTQFGYHVIKLYEKLPASKVEFEKAEPAIRNALKTRGLQRQIPAFMDRLEKEAGVEILDPELKPRPAAPPAESAAEKK
jgi:peptidyl-prolyl cis-trans isomerase C